MRPRLAGGDLVERSALDEPIGERCHGWTSMAWSFVRSLREPLAHARHRHADLGRDLLERHPVVQVEHRDERRALRLVAEQRVEHGAGSAACGGIGELGDLAEQILVAVFGPAPASSQSVQAHVGGDAKQQRRRSAIIERAGVAEDLNEYVVHGVTCARLVAE